MKRKKLFPYQLKKDRQQEQKRTLLYIEKSPMSVKE